MGCGHSNQIKSNKPSNSRMLTNESDPNNDSKEKFKGHSPIEPIQAAGHQKNRSIIFNLLTTKKGVGSGANTNTTHRNSIGSFQAIDMLTLHKGINKNSFMMKIINDVANPGYERVLKKNFSYILKLKGRLQKIRTIKENDEDFQKQIRILDNKQMDYVNYSVKGIGRYYKKQKTPIDGNFIDDVFPPNNNSVYGIRSGRYTDPIEERRKRSYEDLPFTEEDIVWLRAKDIFPGAYTLFANDIDVDDVTQGYIGNCYFMSSLSAMAENPQLICQLFKEFKVAKNSNYYEVGVNINGKWKIVIVDDYFPCHAKTNKPIFAKSRDAEIWVLILEKVWAKVNGGYLNTIGGSASDVIECFTPFPIETINHKKYENLMKDKFADFLWDKVKYASKQGYIMTCLTYEDLDVEAHGLVAGHAFTLASVKEGVINNNPVRLLYLRNPWGYKEWNGPWSDNSSEWTEEARKALNINLTKGDDGKFYMALEDFLKYFRTTQICNIYSPLCSKSYSIQKAKCDLPHVFELHVAKSSIVIISAVKKHWRYCRKLKSDAGLQINILIARKNNENKSLTYINSGHENENNPTVKCNLEPGVYLIYVHAIYEYSTFDSKRKYMVNFSSNTYFNVVEKGIDSDHFDLLKEIMCDKVESSFKKKEDFVSTGNRFEDSTYGYLYLKNKTNDVYNIIGKDESQNFELLKPFKSGEKFNICLNPGEKFIILGIRKSYYEKFVFKIKVEPKKLSQNDEKGEKLVPGTNFNFEIDFYKNSEITITPHEDKYDFIFKKLDFDIDQIIEKIDIVEITKNYFLTKYPDLFLLVNKVPALEDGEKVIFRDFYDINQTSCYLGEWKVKDELVKHGRGLYIWADGSYYMGQFVNDEFEGFGIFQYPNGDRVEINWNAGQMNGVGRYILKDGSQYEVNYVKGTLVEEK
jgi:hypothetical protein